MSAELVIGAILTVVTGLLAAFGKWVFDREKLHTAEIQRMQATCATEIQAKLSEIERIEKALTESRLYNAKLEEENDGLRHVAGSLRDECSMLRTALHTNNLPIPERRRSVTRPLGEMLSEFLEQQKPRPDPDEDKSKKSG